MRNKKENDEKLEAFIHNHYKDYCIEGTIRERIDEPEDIVRTVWHQATKNALYNNRWRKVSEELPPKGEEVLFQNDEWIDEDFNPNGVRIGFMLDEDFVTAHYWSDQDCYMTISHLECDNNPEFSHETRASIEPRKWKPIN